MSITEIIFATAIFIFDIVMLCIINKIVDNKEYISELEDRHWQECAQIAKYEDENRRLKKLLRDIRSHYDHGINCKHTVDPFSKVKKIECERTYIHNSKPPDSKP